MEINKLDGMYRLKKSAVPSIPWIEFKEDSVIPEGGFWTVRTATFTGKDVSLPRAVGVCSSVANAFAKQHLNDNTLVFYYPYYTCRVSGTLLFNLSSTVVEVVEGDLWNLTDGSADYSVKISNDSVRVLNNKRPNILSQEEINNLLRRKEVLSRELIDVLAEGRSIYVEWGFLAPKYEPDKERLLLMELKTC